MYKILFALFALASTSAFACTVAFNDEGKANWSCLEEANVTLFSPAHRSDVEATMKKANPNCLKWCQGDGPSYYCCQNDGNCLVSTVIAP